jgi:hypothetical protein
MNSSSSSARGQSCVDSHRALPEAHLNASKLPSSMSLFVHPFTDTLSPIKTLVDSGASHSFIDPSFVKLHSIPLITIEPIRLVLFDGTSNSLIRQMVRLDLSFSTGHVTPIELLVTRLDGESSVVLGYDWLRLYNPTVDWTNSSLNFQSRTSLPPGSPHTSSHPSHQSPAATPAERSPSSSTPTTPVASHVPLQTPTSPPSRSAHYPVLRFCSYDVMTADL